MFFRKRDTLTQLGMSSEGVCSHLFLVGGTGAGKTSVLRLLMRDILKRGSQGVGVLWAAVKPDEFDNAERVAKAARCQDRLVRLTPGAFRYNFLAYELLRPGGSAVTATKLLQDLNRQLRRSGNEGDEFWANLFAKMSEYAIQACYLAKRGKVTIDDVYRLIMSSPATFEQLASEAFCQKSFCVQTLQAAEQAVQSPAEKRLLEQAANFFLFEAIQFGSKARGAAISQVSAVLSPFIQSPMYETVNCETSNFSPDLVLDGAIAVMDAPVLQHGDAGRFFQTLLTTQVTEAALRRPNPERMAVIVRDELQMLVADPTMEAMNLSVARSQRLAFVSGVQSLPTLQEAMGGNQAEQALHSLLANYSTKLVFSNPCKATNAYFSEAWGQHREEFVSVSESKEEEELDLLNLLTGNDRLLFSLSEQMQPRCPIDAFSRLRRGGGRQRLVDAFLSQAGRTYGNGHSPFTLITFKQTL
ncbi:MAG: type IV secretion system DNA-binding domain-containing protein [Planctomycetales bacterium]|nr:type IV secretion system DNA-binding domain-containing protein [Planctomycetales bacterium]